MTGAEGLGRHASLDDRFDPAVRIVAYAAAWAVGARVELRRCADALGRLAVGLEHVGSTAVPGLAAKPILDLQISVRVLEPRALYVAALERLGYLFVPDPGSPDLHFFARPAQRPRTHYLHVCTAGSDDEFRHLILREFLRAHAGEAAMYEALKRRLVERNPDDRLAYIAGKDAYVRDLEARAIGWGRASCS